MQDNPDSIHVASAAQAQGADLALPAEFTIYAGAELRTQWLGWLDAHAEREDCVVDGAAVTEVGASGLQLLLSLSRTLAARQMTLRLRDPSPPLHAACESLGLAAALLNPAAQGSVA
jgi:anti-anti-sigma regulatory factor